MLVERKNNSLKSKFPTLLLDFGTTNSNLLSYEFKLADW